MTVIKVSARLVRAGCYPSSVHPDDERLPRDHGTLGPTPVYRACTEDAFKTIRGTGSKKQTNAGQHPETR